MGKPRKWKRGRPKDRRAGCLMCKPHKSNAIKDSEAAKTRARRRADLDAAEQKEEA